MSTNEEHKLDELTRRLVHEVGKERPSASLKLNIMQTLNAQSKVIRFKSLISNKAKVAVFVLLVGIIVLSTFLPSDDIIEPAVNELSSYIDLLSIKLPNTFIYGILAVGSLIIVQIPILKKRLDKN